MSPNEFFLKYNGKPIDFDGYYGNQCMDLYRQYVKECLEYPQSPSVQGAADVWDTYLKDYYKRIDNTPDGVPQLGDIVIWNKQAGGGFGHIAIYSSGDVNSFISYDQNWPVGSLCHFQNHNYTNVLGWLRPNKLIQQPTQEPTITDQTKIPQIVDDNGNAMEVQAIRSKLNDQKSTIDSLSLTVASLNTRISELEQKLADIPPSDETLKQTILQAHDIIWGSGWVWVRMNRLKVLIPK